MRADDNFPGGADPGVHPELYKGRIRRYAWAFDQLYLAAPGVGVFRASAAVTGAKNNEILIAGMVESLTVVSRFILPGKSPSWWLRPLRETDQLVITCGPTFGGFGEGESERDLSVIRQIIGAGKNF